jgi:3',5'-cyclic-AMP phosphodiesterase
MLIAQLSDLHVCPPGRLYQRIVDSNRMLRDAIDPIHRLDRAPAPTPF